VTVHSIVLGRDDANSDSALLVEWLVADGATVADGQPVCVVETSKTAIELVAPGGGILRRLAAVGDEVEIGAQIAVVASNAAELASLEREPPAPAPAEPPKATRKAAELAAAHGVDLATIVKTGFITAEDVEAVVAARSGTPGPTVGGLSTANVSTPDCLELPETVGRLDPDFLARLRDDPEAFRALPEAERIELYREHGAHIGEGVRLGRRTLLTAPRIVLEDGVTFGDDGTVTCEESFVAGPLTKFGHRLRFRCRRAALGAGGYVSDDVQVGGGGSSDPQALLVVGDLVFIGEQSFINPCRPILIGREVFVTMRAVLVTHNVGHSLLDGFENRFAPIVLEDRVQIGIGTVVYAGSRIGAESIVGSNSYVVSDLPAGKLAIGVPARVVGSAKHPHSPERRDELARKLFDDLHELLSLRGHDVGPIGDGPLREFTLEASAGAASVLYTRTLAAADPLPAVDGEVIVLTLGLDGEPPPGCAVLDLTARRVHGTGGTVLDSVREFCRKRGIRFEPGPWRYRGGLV